ncbi:hypothetical protein OG949_40100 [Streptomyces scopuliridis]|nr:hypothetical protein [Streptomyces scopuliridis]WSB38404.1 hypothetical protein OG949_40100 [Streptomyces scopuliridis]
MGAVRRAPHHELGLAPEAYEPHPDVDFAKLDPQDQASPER